MKVVRKAVSVAVVVALAINLALPRASAQTTDVPPNHWAQKAVGVLASKGLVLGLPRREFHGHKSHEPV